MSARTSCKLRCTECGVSYAEDPDRLVCPACASHQTPGGEVRGLLEVRLDELPKLWPVASPGSPAFLSAFLPVAEEHLPPLPVGPTPLLEVPCLREALGLPRLWLKDDTRLPSGSTKDRASQLVVAKARQYGRDVIATASTGNAATALAALAAAADLRAVVFVPAAAPEGKLVQMLAYGAELLPVDGSYDDAFELCVAACERFGWYNRNTGQNPFTTEGKKTAALEIAAELAPETPDVVFIPTGDGVILSGLAKGFADLERAGLLAQKPRLVAVQPEGSAAIARAFETGELAPMPGARSVADSLVVEMPRGARTCLAALRSTGGTAVTVSDDAILRAIAKLARTTGVFAEPAAAAALAGLERALADKIVERHEHVVLLVTGTGLKDVPAAARAVRRPEPIAPTLDAVAERLELD